MLRLVKIKLDKQFNKCLDKKKMKGKPMQTYQVHDKAIVLVLTKHEAKALKLRLECHIGVRKTKVFEKVETKGEI